MPKIDLNRAPPTKRLRNFQENLDRLVELMDNEPMFVGVEAEIREKHRSYRVNTEAGTVMYYLSSSRWQWKAEVHVGSVEEFIPWLKHLVTTGKSNRVPQKSTASGRG